jgi:antitoxin (DNA-binding transcriptional repressor) of toxin-antitoxin stability system
MASTDAVPATTDLVVSVDQFTDEPIRWYLDVMDGSTVVITRDGIPFALLKPSRETLQRIAQRGVGSAHIRPEAKEA